MMVRPLASRYALLDAVICRLGARVVCGEVETWNLTLTALQNSSNPFHEHLLPKLLRLNKMVQVTNRPVTVTVRFD